MTTRVREWLARVPATDPFERRSAVTIQVFCIGLSALVLTNVVSRFAEGTLGSGTEGAYGVFADLASVASSLGAVVLMRRGRVRQGFWLVLGSYLALIGMSLALRGLSYHEHLLVRVYAVLFVLAALLLGRVALWGSLCFLLSAMGLGALRDRGMLGGGGPNIAASPPFGTWSQVVAVMLLATLVLDRFGAALAEAYATAVLRRKEAEAAIEQLRSAQRTLESEMGRRAQAEALLFQSQKLEAVGRLSGGIAHDFNNVLTAIMGYAEITKMALPAQHPARGDLDGIVEAAQRAASLTRQLLAFARKQIVEPKCVRIEDRVLAVEPMLRRLLGEQVQIVLALSPERRTVRIDPVQLEQVLVNLAVNARDAMPGGGTLTVGTGAVTVAAGDPVVALGLHPGEHCRLSVSDTGQGMDRSTLENVFEPFFTTKPFGQGTGLGLATCYGIIRQAGGAITVESRLGHGTSFEILLPGVDGDVELERRPVPPAPGGGSETVLVVEDDAYIRELVARVLRARGHTVLVAPDQAGAEECARSHPGEIALVLTDVVLPGSDGKRTVQALRRVHPDISVLYVSGHPDDVVARHGVLEEGVHLLAKPFTPDELARRIREVLDSRRSAAQGDASA